MRRLRALLNAFGVSLTALPGGSGVASELQTPPIRGDAATGVAALIESLARDPGLRARFAADPHAVLREAGVDPALYGSSDALTEHEVSRRLAMWVGPAGPALPERADIIQATQAQPATPPAVVYGPPASPGRAKVMPPVKPPATKPKPPDPAPPAPAYGPPPSLSR